MRFRFCILAVVGDVLDGGELRFLEAARSLGAAKKRVEVLAELRPGQYVIYNEETGERMVIVGGIERQVGRRRLHRDAL